MNEVKWITKNGVHIPITNKYMNDKIRNTTSKSTQDYFKDDNFKYLPDDEIEAYDKYTDMSDESYYKLTDEDRQNIKHYVGDEESYEINNALRSGDTSNINQDIIKSLDKACETYTAKEDMASTRLVSMTLLRDVYKLDIPKYGDVDRSEVAEQMKKFIGTQLNENSYVSTSLNRNGNGMFGNLAVKERINIPVGTKMYIADNLGEYEALLGRNTSMTLKQVGFEPSKIAGFEKEYGKIILVYEIDKK